MLTYIIVIFSVLAIIFIPIVGFIVGIASGLRNKTKWEEDNSDANIINKN